MKIPRIMIAGTHSGVGKTTITTAVMGALSKAGHSVQPYKVGPDYIDPSYHTAATGRKCRNLDTWMLGEETVFNLFSNSAVNAEIAVIEGVMGVFDGSSGVDDFGSSAHVAKLLKCPVILIIDVKSMARSAAALVMGFKNFDPELNVAGVILNRIGSNRHLSLVTEAIEKYCDIPVIGYIRKNAKLELPSRHLGLVPTVEGGELSQTVDSLALEIKEGIDLDKLLQVANSAPDLPSPQKRVQTPSSLVKIGIAFDEAFSFYYEDGLEILRELGAELIPFSPIHDSQLPSDVDGIYIGGGFPEVFIKELTANQAMRNNIKLAGNSGMPVYAECGGLMYLSEAIVDFEQNSYPMVGLVPAACIMEKKLVGMGYIQAKFLQDTIIGPAGTSIKGHEFHYSRLAPFEPGFEPSLQITRNRSKEVLMDGYSDNNVLASYVHLHFASAPQLARNLIKNCQAYRKKTQMSGL